MENKPTETAITIYGAETSQYLENHTGCLVYPGGTKEWRLNGKTHREDGPAYEGADGHKEWWWYGKFVCSNRVFYGLKGNYIVVERGIPTKETLGNLKLTQAKLLTANGTKLAYDNLPGFEIVD